MAHSHLRTRILVAIGATSFAAAVANAGCGGSTSTGVSLDDAGADAADGQGTGDALADVVADAPIGADAAGDAPADVANSPDVTCVRRPFLVGAELRACDVRERDDWMTELAAATQDVDDVTRAALARAWLEDARQEHASIAAFARFTMLMLAVGAPPELVAASQRASIDEIAHARACFALHARYSGEARGPARLSLVGALPEMSLEELAVLTVHEGCVGETLGAILATEQLEQARDPDVRALLARLVKDEERHAALAWRFVRWAIGEGGGGGGAKVRHAVRRAFAEAEQEARRQVFTDEAGIDADAWRAHGRLTAAGVATALRRGLDDVVGPCARALVEGGPAVAQAGSSCRAAP